jgi:hypothetical protein
MCGLCRSLVGIGGFGGAVWLVSGSSLALCTHHTRLVVAMLQVRKKKLAKYASFFLLLAARSAFGFNY